MRAQDIRKLTKEQIENKIVELKEELFNLKFQAALGNLQKPARMSEVKRDIARMKTILTEESYNKEETPKKKPRAKKKVEETSNEAAE